MRRSLVIFLLFLLPFQVFAARLDGALAAAWPGNATQVDMVFADQSGGVAETLAALPLLSTDHSSGIDDDTEESPAHADLSDTLIAMPGLALPPGALLARPQADLGSPASLFLSVPKPPPEA